MACCLEYQDECKRVVTISYLKSFIKDGSTLLIQNSSGDGVNVPSSYNDTYCPTYGELTGGTIIQTWAAGTTPNGDRDGIVVSSTSTGAGGAYSNSQLVNQKDLSLRYTRFKEFTVSSDSGDIDQCGGDKNISYTHTYTRYTKSMGNTCTTSTTNSDVSDTTNSEVTWAGCTWLSVNGTNLTVTAERQPGRTASRRYCTVSGTVVFRTTSHSSTTTIYQAALGGSYSSYKDRYYTAVTASNSTSGGKSSFDCAGGSFSISSIGYYYDRYMWKDDCGTVYDSSPYDDRNGSENAGSNSGSFSVIDPCNYAYGTTYTSSSSLTVTYHGITSNAINFSQACAGISGMTYEWILNNKVLNSFTVASPNKPDSFEDCDAGTIQYYGVLNYTENYYRRDNCGHDFPSVTSAVTKTDNILNGGNYYEESYVAVEPDCEAYLVAEKPVSVSTVFNGSTITASKTFTISCPPNPDQPKCTSDSCNIQRIVGSGNTIPQTGGSLKLAAVGCGGKSCFNVETTYQRGYQTIYRFTPKDSPIPISLAVTATVTDPNGRDIENYGYGSVSVNTSYIEVYINSEYASNGIYTLMYQDFTQSPTFVCETEFYRYVNLCSFLNIVQEIPGYVNENGGTYAVVVQTQGGAITAKITSDADWLGFDEPTSINLRQWEMHSFYCSISPNTTGSERSCKVKLYANEDVCYEMEVTQAA